jgi:hypothetical protein
MARQGAWKFLGELDAAQAYAVVDFISCSKDGTANCHVSVYARPPKTVELAQQRAVVVNGKEVVEDVVVESTDRGPVIEHFNVSGIKLSDKSAFISCYEQLPELDERFASMDNA